MRRRGSRVGIAVALVGAHALSGCAGDLDEPLLGEARADLANPVWAIADIGDFNGDGLGDVLWNAADQSEMAVWLMAGTEVVLPGLPIPGPPGVEWNVAWASDFNADNLSDARWYNSATNETAIWLMAGTELLLPGATLPGPAGVGWERVTSADFSADGMADLLWRNKLDHSASVWLMNGTEVFLPGPAFAAPPGDGWFAATAGDFNGDGMVDVLWFDPTVDSIAIELMNATEPVLQLPALPGPLGAGWHVVTASDFNGDGMADVLWYNTMTQSITVWLMAGADLLLAGPEIPGPPGGGWLAFTTGDLNGDGMGDVAWENLGTQRFAAWLMAGTALLLAGPEIPMPSGG